MSTTSIFFNQSFDKKRLKSFLYWVLKTFGEKEALTVVEQLKSMGFYNATKAGLSIGLHDLKTPYKKKLLISNAQTAMRKTDQEFQGAEVTATERSQRIVDTWHRTSEDLRKQVVDYFSTYDQLNSVYMMALSGARGNFSQVRQLIGMRGLMADPQGQIISFPIRSNLREGLTLTEYFISCSGARKGLVDTALRTADTGYLTRRLVDISHHIVVKKVTCYTSRGIALKTLRTSQKILLPLQDRLVGRVLAENIYDNNDIELSSEQRYLEGTVLHQDKTASYQKENSQTPTKLDKVKRSTNLIRIKKQTEQGDLGKKVIARKNQEISPNLALKICLAKENCLHKENKMSSLDMRESKNKLYFKKDRTLTDLSMPQVLVRSPLTCTYTHEVCQLCYGWSMAQGSLVSLGEAVGVIAGQSIGEPGTQLTMRTFHTGGVFSGDLLQEIRAPHSGKILFPKALQGLLIRTSQGRIAFLIKVSGELLVDGTDIDGKVENNKTTKLQLAPSTILFVRQGERVKSHQLLAELAITSEEGNQPIKSRQTLFAEIGGRIVQWKSMTARIHRTRGTLPKPSTLGKVRSKNSFCIRSFSVQSNKISLSYQLDEAVPPKKESKISKKSGIQAYLGPIDATRNSSYSAFDKSKFITQATARQSLWNLNEFRAPVEKRSFAPRSEKTKFLYEERNVQHYEETWDHLNNLTLKKIAITKRHGLGSIEPPKALKLGLLGVIATRVGASEKTCTKGTFSNQTATLLPALKKAVIHKNEKKLISSNMVNKASLKALHSQNEIVANTKRSLLQSFAVVKNEVFYTQRTTECKTSFCNRLHEQVQASKNEIFARTQPVREIGAQRLLYLKTQMARLQHLNTIAEEGDLVDENYTQM